MSTWNYKVVAKGTLAGFEGHLVEGGRLLFVSALTWNGAQPRIVLERYPHPTEPEQFGYCDAGFEDWLPVLQECSESHSFEGDSEHAQNLVDQWIFNPRSIKAKDKYGRRAAGKSA